MYKSSADKPFPCKRLSRVKVQGNEATFRFAFQVTSFSGVRSYSKEEVRAFERETLSLEIVSVFL